MIIGVIGLRLNISISHCPAPDLSTISTPYITGVIYWSAITNIPRIYCKSLKYTVIDDTISAIPRHNIYSTIITTGRHSNASGLIVLPAIITTPNTTRNVSIILTNALVTVDIGSTSRGKYIFLTISFSFNILPAPSVTLDEKNIHGTNATKRNR